MMSERLQILRDRYYLLVPPIILCLAIGISSDSAVMQFTFGITLTLLTLNQVVGLLQQRD